MVLMPQNHERVFTLSYPEAKPWDIPWIAGFNRDVMRRSSQDLVVKNSRRILPEIVLTPWESYPTALQEIEAGFTSPHSSIPNQVKRLARLLGLSEDYKPFPDSASTFVLSVGLGNFCRWAEPSKSLSFNLSYNSVAKEVIQGRMLVVAFPVADRLPAAARTHGYFEAHQYSENILELMPTPDEQLKMHCLGNYILEEALKGNPQAIHDYRTDTDRPGASRTQKSAPEILIPQISMLNKRNTQQWDVSYYDHELKGSFIHLAVADNLQAAANLVCDAMGAPRLELGDFRTDRYLGSFLDARHRRKALRQMATRFRQELWQLRGSIHGYRDSAVMEAERRLMEMRHAKIVSPNA